MAMGFRRMNEEDLNIGLLRSFCAESVPVLWLTATVNNDYRELIKVSCSLSNNVKVLYSCSDSPNIRLSIVKRGEKKYLMFKMGFFNVGVLQNPNILIYNPKPIYKLKVVKAVKYYRIRSLSVFEISKVVCSKNVLKF